LTALGGGYIPAHRDLAGSGLPALLITAEVID
jgi:hypothetical protein